MMGPSLILLLAAFIQQWRITESVTLNQHAEDYLKKIILEFQNDPTKAMYDHVIMPPRIGETIDDFLLPKIFIWCPIDHYGLQILCPVHKSPLIADYFTDVLQKKSPRNPRLVYDIGGNLLLVQRAYLCQSTKGMYHRYLSASLDILETIPKLYGIGSYPISMFYKSACTKKLINLVETQLLQGVNFLSICEGIAGLNFKEYHERVLCFTLMKSLPLQDSDTLNDRFYSDQLYAFPGNDKLMEIFLANFPQKQPLCDAEMRSIAKKSKCITCDHTFKASKYICASRGSDKKCIKQFENLYIALNEKHEVVAWKLTKSTKFEEIQKLLSNLKDCLEHDLEYIIVDDCCKVRALYNSIFPDALVKLDVFHAVQRIVKTFPKGTQWSKQISNEIGLIFRKDGDLGNSRHLATPDPCIIERNLNNFIRKWQGTFPTDIEHKILKEIENLRVHIRKGCLSGINPGQGTECNERLHQTLNKSLLCGSTTIGPQLAIAILTIIFYGINCRIQEKKHSSNSRVVPFVPLPQTSFVINDGAMKAVELNNPNSFSENVKLDNVWNKSDSSKIKDLKLELILVIERVEDMFTETVSNLLLQSATRLKETLEEIGNRCKDRSINVFNLPVFQRLSQSSVLHSNDDNISQLEHRDVLKRNLLSFDLMVDPVAGDGDCAFRSIITQLRKTIQLVEGNGLLVEHLQNLGLRGEDDDEDIWSLRQLFVNTVQSNEYYQMLLGIQQEDVNAQTERFRESGSFSGEVGDLVMKVLSDILKIPILIITSLPQCPCVPFIPDEQISICTLYVAFNAYGPGHYDGTVTANSNGGSLSDFVENELRICSCGKNRYEKEGAYCTPGSRCSCLRNERSCSRKCRCKHCQNKPKYTKEIQESRKSCRCGESSTGTELTCIDAKRKSRCPCLKDNMICGAQCSCRNCGNGKKSNVNVESSPQNPRKRKRNRTTPTKVKKVRSAEYLASLNVPVSQKVWTVSEQCLLLAIASFLSSTLVSPSIENVFKLFNNIACSNVCEEAKLPIRVKTYGQIAAKLKQLEDKRDVFFAR